jgi:hypothetical protein
MADAMLVTLTVSELEQIIDRRIGAALAEHVSADVPRLLDRAGLARVLGCSLPVIDRLRKNGMPKLKIGNVDRFEIDRVLAWLRSRGERGSLRLVGGNGP